jgi:hypothetical protein
MKKIYILGFMVLVLSCDPPKESAKDLSKIKQMEWVIGDWENLSKDGDLYESWSKTDDSTFAGKSFMIVNKDTVYSEKISLELRNNDLNYVAIVSDQPPVSFKFTALDKDEMIFENKAHDFPQRVVYKELQTDSLYARIEGSENGKPRQEEFRMIKRK